MKSKTAQLILQKQSDTTKGKNKNVIVEKSKFNYYQLFSFMQKPFKNQTTQLIQRKVQELQGQNKLLEKQNFRLIQANVELLKQSLYIAEQIKENILTTILHICISCLYLEQYHYVEANKYLYTMLQKISNFIQSKQCPGKLSSLRKSHINKRNQIISQPQFPDQIQIVINQQGNPQATPKIKAFKKIPIFFIQNQVNFIYEPPTPLKQLAKDHAEFKQFYRQQSDLVSRQDSQQFQKQSSQNKSNVIHNVINTNPLIEEKPYTARQNTRKSSWHYDNKKQEPTIATSRERQLKISLSKDKTKNQKQSKDSMYYLILSQALSIQSLLRQ